MKKSKSKNYGVNDTQPCEQCGGPMSLVRRTPHPDSPAELEVQIFSCNACEHEQSRLANPDGVMFPYDLAADAGNSRRPKKKIIRIRFI